MNLFSKLQLLNSENVLVYSAEVKRAGPALENNHISLQFHLFWGLICNEGNFISGEIAYIQGPVCPTGIKIFQDGNKP